jgi:protein-S-isoprenylcysteine O-methyltransferase Ste14
MDNRPVQALELKIPPVALVIVAAVLMWLGSAYAPRLNVELPFRAAVGFVFGLLGLITCILGVVEFKRAKTTVNPTKPQSSSSLVASGIYRHTRNPMYLGFF